MVVYYDETRVQPAPRCHPWVVGEMNTEFRYYDFKRNPELIPKVLEDFIPLAHFDAIQHFYEFLAWVNGPESQLETNDCALRPPGPHRDPNSIRKLCCHGRVDILYRRLDLNVRRDCADWLIGKTMKILKQDIDIQFTANDGVIAFSQNQSFFTNLARAKHEEKLGWQCSIHFWAYGDTESECMGTLKRVFSNLWKATQTISKEMEVALKSNVRSSLTN
jgi:hypothetical protein